MKVDRVLIDTNVIVSGVAFEGNERRLLKLASEGLIDALLPSFVIAEAEIVMADKFPHLSVALRDLLDSLAYEEPPAPPQHLIEQAARLLRDPGDADILACAMEVKPDALVTGDKDLLTEEVLSLVPACRCADYLRKSGYQ